MIDHVSVCVKDISAARAFYEKALAPLGYVVKRSYPTACGFGDAGKLDFWLIQSERIKEGHIAFSAPNREIVRAFHAAALAAGGEDAGAPGPRSQYHAHYYGAFVLDPDGHNVEAVCHKEG